VINTNKASINALTSQIADLKSKLDSQITMYNDAQSKIATLTENILRLQKMNIEFAGTLVGPQATNGICPTSTIVGGKVASCPDGKSLFLCYKNVIDLAVKEIKKINASETDKQTANIDLINQCLMIPQVAVVAVNYVAYRLGINMNDPEVKKDYIASFMKKVDAATNINYISKEDMPPLVFNGIKDVLEAFNENRTLFQALTKDATNTGSQLMFGKWQWTSEPTLNTIYDSVNKDATILNVTAPAARVGFKSRFEAACPIIGSEGPVASCPNAISLLSCIQDITDTVINYITKVQAASSKLVINPSKNIRVGSSTYTTSAQYATGQKDAIAAAYSQFPTAYIKQLMTMALSLEAAMNYVLYVFGASDYTTLVQNIKKVIPSDVMKLNSSYMIGFSTAVRKSLNEPMYYLMMKNLSLTTSSMQQNYEFDPSKWFTLDAWISLFDISNTYNKALANKIANDAGAKPANVLNSAPDLKALAGPYPKYLGFVASESAFCLGGSAFNGCIPIPYVLDFPDSKFDVMLKNAESRTHKYFAIAGRYGFTFNVLDTTKLVTDGSGNYACVDKTDRYCGCFDGTCKKEHGTRNWSVYQIKD
jgi:hypothetical protein